jgi:acyl dehydratase
MINYAAVRNVILPEIRQQYNARDTILYALGLGFGSDPLDFHQLRFVYEQGLQSLPTMAVVLGSPGPWMRQPGLGIDFVKMVHGEQGMTVHAQLPATGEVIGRSRITHVVDKGAGKGAVVQVERSLQDASTGDLLVTLTMQLFCRADGGFATESQPGDEAPPALAAVPSDAPDVEVDIATRPEAALLYRLSGDYNPLHADPEVARRAGFDRPILHGLASYGMAFRALLMGVLEQDPRRLRTMRARFSSPVLPGDTLRTSIWRCGNEVLFKTRALERDVVVIGAGVATLVSL